MLGFDMCPPGTRVTWTPTNKDGEPYYGSVIAHNRSGEDIYRIPGYAEKRAGNPNRIVNFDRVVVEAEHDEKWHAQDLEGLQLA
jgi:hypothetical protein